MSEQYIIDEFDKLSEDAQSIKSYIEIDLTKLQDQMVSHAPGYVYLAQFAAMAKGQCSASKNRAEAIRGELFYSYKVGNSTGAKALSDETVKAMVACNPKYMEARAEQALAEMDDVYWSAVMSAMNQRGYFLRELYNQDKKDASIERQYPTMMQETLDNLQTMRDSRDQYEKAATSEGQREADEIQARADDELMEKFVRVAKRRP